MPTVIDLYESICKYAGESHEYYYALITYAFEDILDQIEYEIVGPSTTPIDSLKIINIIDNADINAICNVFEFSGNIPHDIKTKDIIPIIPLQVWLKKTQ